MVLAVVTGGVVNGIVQAVQSGGSLLAPILSALPMFVFVGAMWLVWKNLARPNGLQLLEYVTSLFREETVERRQGV